jgi:hypothetical protein
MQHCDCGRLLRRVVNAFVRSDTRLALKGHAFVVRQSCLFLLGRNFRFDVHIAELARFEDLAAVETLDVFRVVVTGNNLDTRMEALLVHRFAL